MVVTVKKRMLSVSLLGLFVENLLLFCSLIKIQLEVYGNGKDKNIESYIPTFPAITPGDKKKKILSFPSLELCAESKGQGLLHPERDSKTLKHLSEISVITTFQQVFLVFFWTKQRIQRKNYNAVQYYLTRNRSRKTGAHQGRPLGNCAK